MEDKEWTSTFECSAHIPFCAGMFIAVSVSMFLSLCSVLIGWRLSLGLPLTLFATSVFLTMTALSLCCEPNGWLVKGTEMLCWLVSDALHLYSAQGAKPLRKRRARTLSLWEPLPALMFPCTTLPWWTFLFPGAATSAAPNLDLGGEIDKMCGTYRPVVCFGLFYFWLWNAALGSRQLHGEHLVPALILAVWGIRVGREMWSTLWVCGQCRSASGANS